MEIIVRPQSADESAPLTPLEFTEFAIQHKGKPIHLNNRPWLETIYNLPVQPQEDGRYRRKILLVFGRQSEKSTTIGNNIISLSNLIPYFASLYVTASDAQMREFSALRLKAVIDDSPILQQQVGIIGDEDRQVQNVQTKQWVNQSRIVLRAAFRSPDRSRGISADLLTVDELQDIVLDHLPVIQETVFHSEFEDGPIFYYAGTPKTFDNTLEYYWSRLSTQNEWMVQCQTCKRWSIIEAENICPEGLRCILPRSGQPCSTLLNPIAHGRWVRTGKKEAPWEGFRLPQPVVIYAMGDGRPDVFMRMWDELLIKQQSYTSARFMNEVMARSYDAGTKPVTFQEVRNCCLKDLSMVKEVTPEIRSRYCWAGIDYGTGESSYTILSIWDYDPYGRFRLLFAKRYEGIEADPDYSIEDIIKICRAYNITMIGADWGFGFALNAKLQKAFGANKVMLYCHSGSQSAKIAWDKEGGKFTTHRTRVLQDIFTLIKRGPVSGGITFVNWEEMESFAADILAVYSEYSERLREMKFDHPRGKPDDFLHSLCYAFLVSQFQHARPDVNAPGANGGSKK